MKLVKSGPTGSDDTATYDVVEYPKKLADFIQEVLKRINEWGSIKIKGYGSIDYKYGKSSNDITALIFWGENHENIIFAPLLHS